MDSGADNHYIDDEGLPNIEERMRDIKILEPPLRISTFGGQVSLGTKTGKLQINARTKEGKAFALCMRVVITSGAGSTCSLLQGQQRRALLADRTEVWLSEQHSKIPLRQSSDICRVYLDANIARKPSDYLIKLIQRNDQQTT